MPKTERDIAKNIKTLEWLKAQMVIDTGAVLQAIWRGTSQEIEDGLASLMVHIYLLANRLGISCGRMEHKIFEKTQELIKVSQKESGAIEENLEALKMYLDIKR